MVNIWTPPRMVSYAPIVMGVLLVLAIALGSLLPAGLESATTVAYASFGFPLLGLILGFSTLMTLWNQPTIRQKHPRLKTTLLILMAIILVYMVVAVIYVISTLYEQA